MNKVLRFEDSNPNDVISLGKAIIEYIDEKNIKNITADTPSVKNYPVEIFMESTNNTVYDEINNSVYIYAGDSDGNVYEHINGYIGLWVKREKEPNTIDKNETKTTDVKPNYYGRYEPIDHGFCSHDCCSYLECPVCGHNFNSWQVKMNDPRCPKCNIPLEWN